MILLTQNPSPASHGLKNKFPSGPLVFLHSWYKYYIHGGKWPDGGEETGNMEFIERKRWLFLGLPFTFTKYSIKEDMITIDTGLLKVVENDCYMYKVQDVEHVASLAERIFRLGTIICYTGDTTHPKLLIEHVRNSKAIKEFILKESEEARLRRRTVNMLDIGSGEMDDDDL